MGLLKKSQTNYESALASARKILADDSATQETVDNALAALQDARNHLVKKDDTPKDDGKTDDGKTDDGKTIMQPETIKKMTVSTQEKNLQILPPPMTEDLQIPQL